MSIEFANVPLLSVYIPPLKGEKLEETWTELGAVLQTTAANSDREIITFGDYNAHSGKKDATSDVQGSLLGGREMGVNVKTDPAGEHLQTLSRELDFAIWNGRFPDSSGATRQTLSAETENILDYALSNKRAFAKATNFSIKHGHVEI